MWAQLAIRASRRNPVGWQTSGRLRLPRQPSNSMKVEHLDHKTRQAFRQMGSAPSGGGLFFPAGSTASAGGHEHAPPRPTTQWHPWSPSLSADPLADRLIRARAPLLRTGIDDGYAHARRDQPGSRFRFPWARSARASVGPREPGSARRAGQGHRGPSPGRSAYSGAPAALRGNHRQSPPSGGSR